MTVFNNINPESFRFNQEPPEAEFEDDYDESEEGDIVLDEYCPNCHHEYDQIDYEFQICHICNYENKPIKTR